MPVQPQFSIGLLGQAAPPDGNQMPAQVDGNARYVRSSPPQMFGNESPIESCQRLSDITLLTLPGSPLHRNSSSLTGMSTLPNVRRSLDGYSFADLEDSLPLARRENIRVPNSTGFSVPLHGRSRPDMTPIRYPPLCSHSPIDLHGMNCRSHARDEFHVIKEDFPALPRIPEAARPPACHQTESAASGGTVQTDSYDLKSYMDRWSSREFYEAYRVLNFEDVVDRSEKLHPLGECAMEAVSRALPIENLQIGVNVFNPCTQLNEPEDLRAEHSSYRIINGYKVPVPENDRCYAMSDVLKDKLRNPRLQMMDDFTLFFQFYFFSRDTLQLIAADALFQRNWRWNKKISRWCRFERAQPQGAMQIGVFQVYDPATNRNQTISLPYSSHDFELCPPVIPPPMLRTSSMNYE